MIRWVSSQNQQRWHDEMYVQCSFEKYGYGVTVLVAEGFGAPKACHYKSSPVAYMVMKWAEKFDVGRSEMKKTLLILTYSGHAEVLRDPDEGLRSLYAIAWVLIFSSYSRNALKANPDHSREDLTESFNVSWVQLKCRQQIKNSDLFILLDCPYASFQGSAAQYQGCPLMQMEVLAASNGPVRIAAASHPTNFALRVSQDLDLQMGALTVRQRSTHVQMPGEMTGEGVHQLVCGTPTNSIVIAPLRQPDGSINKHAQEWMAEELLDVGSDDDELPLMPSEGAWNEFLARPVSPPARVDAERHKVDRQGGR